MSYYVLQDGRLSRGDQLLCINSQSLLGKSNSEALDTLRKTLATATGTAGAGDSGSKIKLVVARRTGINKNQPGMAALEESPREVSNEMGWPGPITILFHLLEVVVIGVWCIVLCPG